MLSNMRTRTITRLGIIMLAVAVAITAALVPACATTAAKKKPVVRQGYNYQLTKSLKVYKGPGKDYGYVLRKDLKPSTRKYAVKNSEIAKLKKGTVVTCLKIKGHWAKIPSGWINVSKNNVKEVNRKSRR